MLVTHGVAGGPGVAASHAAALAARLPGVAVRVACLRGEPRLETVVDGLSARLLLLLPVLMADGYIRDGLERRLRERGIRPPPLLLPPLGSIPALAAVLTRMAQRTAREAGLDPATTTLVLVAHGTPKHPASGRTVAEQAARIERSGRFAAVETAFLEQEPFLADRLLRLCRRPAVVVGFFVDAGPHGRDDVRRVLEGFPAIPYAGVVGERPEVVPLLLDMAQSALRRPPLRTASEATGAAAG
ncbi:hypothetical protein HRbin40_00406 [bacterium HR40]|nr:hypothetical protein HRbin40_00406 [bacterium HR40]